MLFLRTASRVLGWTALALAAAAAILVVLPLQPQFLLPGLDDSFAATLHYAAAHRELSLISTCGPLGFVHYPLYTPETFTALVGWRLAIAGATLVPLAWLGWAGSRSPWGAALAVGFAAPFLAGDDLRGVLAANLAILLSLAPRRPPALVSLIAGAGLGIAALIKGTFLILGALAVVVGTLPALRAPRRAPWLLLGATVAAGATWVALGRGIGDAAAFLDWSLREIAPGYAQAMQLPARPVLIAQAALAVALLAAGGVLLARRAPPPRWGAALGFAAFLFLAFKVGFVRPEVHMFIAVDLLLIDAVLVALLWGGTRIGRVLAAALLLGALPAALYAQIVASGVLPSWSYRIASAREIRERVHRLPELRDRRAFDEAHEQSAFAVRIGQPLPPLEGPVDVYTCQQGVVLAHGLALRPRPVFQSYMAYTPRLAHANADWLASERAAPRILVRPASLNNRWPAQDDAPSWPLLLSRYDVMRTVGGFAVLERRAVARPWRLTPLGEVEAATGETIAVPHDRRVWARIDVPTTLEDRAAAVALAAPTVWLTTTFADGHTVRWRLVPALARDGFLLSPLVNDADSFTRLLSDADAPDLRTVVEIRLDLLSPFGGAWTARPVHVAFSALEIEP